MIWYYTFGVNCVRAFSRSHTHLFHFTKSPDDFTFNSENPSIRILSARQLVYADRLRDSKPETAEITLDLTPTRRTTMGFRPNARYTGKFAGCRDFLLTRGFPWMPNAGTVAWTHQTVSRSDLQDLVLDPFAGSGTTLAVANPVGRLVAGLGVVRRLCEKNSKTSCRNTSGGSPGWTRGSGAKCSEDARWQEKNPSSQWPTGLRTVQGNGKGDH